MEYKLKYIKYKTKYIQLKKIEQSGGGKNKIVKFLDSPEGKEIIEIYFEQFNELWNNDLNLSKKQTKKITKKLIKKAMLSYLKNDNIDSQNIKQTFKWESYMDTFVKDSIIDYILNKVK